MTLMVTLEDAKTWLRYPNPSDSSSDDDAIESVIEAAADVIGYLTGLDMVVTPHVEQHNGGRAIIVLYHKPVIQVSSVLENTGAVLAWELDQTAVDNAVVVSATGANNDDLGTVSPYSYSVDDYDQGIISRRSVGFTLQRFTPGFRNIEVSYQSGFTSSTLPATLALAAKELIAHIWQNSQLRAMATAPQYVAFDAVNMVNTDRVGGNIALSFGIPSRVMELCQPFRRDPILA